MMESGTSYLSPQCECGISKIKQFALFLSLSLSVSAFVPCSFIELLMLITPPRQTDTMMTIELRATLFPHDTTIDFEGDPIYQSRAEDAFLHVFQPCFHLFEQSG
jgi:hypothetical protein